MELILLVLVHPSRVVDRSYGGKRSPWCSDWG
jgi:hypothetical protein